MIVRFVPTAGRFLALAGFVTVLFAAPGCNGTTEEGEEASGGTAVEEPAGEVSGDESSGAGEESAADETFPPEHVLVQHVLIGFQGSVRGKQITRTQAEARTLAYEVLERARGGEDFGQLVQQYTDDQFPGVYGMSNVGVQPNDTEFPRDRMVSGFGDVAFSLRPGEVGIADYDPQTSPFGWHVIKRVE